jgi:hypothetical protein
VVSFEKMNAAVFTVATLYAICIDRLADLRAQSQKSSRRRCPEFFNGLLTLLARDGHGDVTGLRDWEFFYFN